MNAQQVWQSQALDAPRITLAYVRHHADRLRTRIRIRNAFQYVGAVAAIVFSVAASWNFLHVRPLMCVATALWMLATVFVLARWHRRASGQAPAEQLGTLDALQFYREQLARQRDAHRGTLRRLVPPLAPSVVVTLVALFVEVKPTPWLAIVFVVVWVVCTFTLGTINDERVARRFQQEIDALDSMSPKS